MADVTQILDAAHRGDRKAAAELLPLVYDELRKLAAARMADETPGNTLNATALVHEAYLRLVGRPTPPAGTTAATSSPPRPRPCGASWSRAPAEGGPEGRGLARVDLAAEPAAPEPADDLLALDEALDRLAADDPQVAELVKLRYFVGLTIPQAAEVLGVSPRTADAWWAFARAWLLARVREEDR